MAAEGAVCGFVYLEGTAWAVPEDTEPLASCTLGHGNHRESSPFLSPLEASRGIDYYDRNLALFEVVFTNGLAVIVAKAG
uniref:Solute carrier family 12 member 4 n=1 Tax=Homo sapiens TaxID=9606 RepID=A0A994J5J8_HUMAN